ncbi:S8 family serine peptidase [Streptomyces xiaopingdaonensis]|uniref:S8 family serine peptidase n=1 Tax=Streptomyces xiaopingdaonensis TaxID=1565415 RepID=UPI00138B08C5|nr:S8 family serine peptidase [Streptomyces xiaopingdaonensis]
MKAEDMWKVSQGGGVKVAVIDSGVNPTSALSGRLSAGKDVSGAPGGATDDPVGHGTSVAELIAGNGRGDNVAGLAPKASILPIRTAGEGIPGARDTSTLEKAVRFAADSDAQIINMSLGGYGDKELESALNYAKKKGKLMFAGTGNDGNGENRTPYPAGSSDVIGIGSVDSTGKVADTSGNGRHVSLAAPGVDMPTSCGDSLEDHCTGEGTSYATALASASAALIWSKHPDWTANQVARALTETTSILEKDEKPSNYLGYGIVRPKKHLLEGVGEPGAPDKPAFKKNGEFVPAEASLASPSASETAGSRAEGGGGNEAAEKPAAQANEPESSSLALWWGVGVVAAVVVIGGAVTLVLRKRRAG